MKNIGERIRAARLAKNLKQEELADLVGAKYRSVSTWEVGSAKPDCLTLLRICEVLNVSPDYVLGYSSENPNPSEMVMIRKYRLIDDLGKQAVEAVLNIEHERTLLSQPKKQKARLLKVDFFGYAASAGTGNFLETETPDEIWVKESPKAEAADFVIPIAGDSMEPTFHSGDKVFVEKCASLSIGEIGIFIVNGEALIKELGNQCLISHNAYYKPIKLIDDDNVLCCGKVLGIVEE